MRPERRKVNTLPREEQEYELHWNQHQKPCTQEDLEMKYLKWGRKKKRPPS